MLKKVYVRFLCLIIVGVVAVGLGAQCFGRAASSPVASDGAKVVSASASLEWASAGILAAGALIMFALPRRRKQQDKADR